MLFILKWRKFKIKGLRLHSTKLEKEGQIKPKIGRGEIIKEKQKSMK